MKRIGFFILWGLILLASTSDAPAAKFFISASGPSGDGSGSNAGNAADASTQEKFRAINERQNKPGTVIVYAPETYEVSPAFTMYDHVTGFEKGARWPVSKLSGSAQDVLK